MLSVDDCLLKLDDSDYACALSVNTIMATDESAYYGKWKVSGKLMIFSTSVGEHILSACRLTSLLFYFQIVECVSLAGTVEPTGIEG